MEIKEIIIMFCKTLNINVQSLKYNEEKENVFIGKINTIDFCLTIIDNIYNFRLKGYKGFYQYDSKIKKIVHKQIIVN